MTKTRPIQQPPPKPLHEGPGTMVGGSQLGDACELFLAELQVRRDRLEQLLNLVRLEVGRVKAARVPFHPRHKCAAVRRERRNTGA